MVQLIHDKARGMQLADIRQARIKPLDADGAGVKVAAFNHIEGTRTVRGCKCRNHVQMEGQTRRTCDSMNDEAIGLAVRGGGLAPGENLDIMTGLGERGGGLAQISAYAAAASFRRKLVADKCDSHDVTAGRATRRYARPENSPQERRQRK